MEVGEKGKQILERLGLDAECLRVVSINGSDVWIANDCHGGWALISLEDDGFFVLDCYFGKCSECNRNNSVGKYGCVLYP